MKPRPKTIQIFLPGGDPRGIRIAELTTRIVQAIEIPRSLLAEFIKMEESGQVGVYFLFGDEGDGSQPRVYIGQTGELKTRLTQHNQKKEFWQRAVVLISRTNSMTQTHALFLEWFSLQEAQRIGRYGIENGNAGSCPHTPAPLEADCQEIFETGGTLLSVLGYPLFEELVAAKVVKGKKELFYCKGVGAEGQGVYTADGFVVLKGSVARRGNTASLADARVKFREQLEQEGVLQDVDGKLHFVKDRAFKSPSTAAMAVLGRECNGWAEWKDADGVTLNDRKRGKEEDAERIGGEVQTSAEQGARSAPDKGDELE